MAGLAGGIVVAASLKLQDNPKDEYNRCVSDIRAEANVVWDNALASCDNEACLEENIKKIEDTFEPRRWACADKMFDALEKRARK